LKSSLKIDVMLPLESIYHTGNIPVKEFIHGFSDALQKKEGCHSATYNNGHEILRHAGMSPSGYRNVSAGLNHGP